MPASAPASSRKKPFAIRQAVGDQPEIAAKSRLRRYRVVGRRVEAVVDRHAVSRTVALVSRHHRRSAAIGQDHVISRDELGKGILAMRRDPIQRRRRVDIPEHGKRAGELVLTRDRHTTEAFLRNGK